MVAPVTIECSPPESLYYPGRFATLKIMGVEILRDFVYDVDPDGNRTEEQAAKNLLHVLRQRLADA